MRTDEVVIPASLPSPAPDSPLEALSWLGDTVEEVAEGLRARGIKGQRSQSSSCPLHHYLRQFGFSVCIDYSSTRGTFTVGATKYSHLPHLVQFTKGFDGGQFPDLIDNG